MKEQLMKRMEQLKAEFESGQKMLADTEARRQSLQQTLLRLSGAIQVLEEECAKEQPAGGQAAAKRDEPVLVSAATR
jgi:hypothetical protein